MSAKPPERCADMAEIRSEVSALDQRIIALLGERLEYVKAAVRFKPDEGSIRNPDHWEAFFADRRRWAAQAGYDPAVIEALYRRLYEHTVQVQLALHALKPRG